MTPEEIRTFWIGEISSDDVVPTREHMRLWFGKDEAVDAHIVERFAPMIPRAIAGELDAWLEDDASAIAWFILIDQFSRNAFRNTAAMYAGDARTLEQARRLIARGHRHLHPIERMFVYLPLEHAEDLDAQNECVALFRQLADDVPPQAKEAYQGYIDYAIRHQVIVERFGRFPHRNAILGRQSTPEELEFLAQPNSSF